MAYERFDIKPIEIEDLTDLELLKTHYIYREDFEKLPVDRQKEIYTYCKLHANNYGCIENLEHIRYAVTRMYFKSLGVDI